MEKSNSRRTFIKTSSIAVGAISAGGILTNCTTPNIITGKNGMPRHMLGKVGEKIYMVGYSCGSQIAATELVSCSIKAAIGFTCCLFRTRDAFAPSYY